MGSRFSVAHGSSRMLPGVVPGLEVKAHIKTTLCGARGWLLRCSRHGGTAHIGGGARCDLKIRAMAERPDGDGKGRCNEEGKTKPASTSRVYGGWRTWPWRREPWAVQKTVAASSDAARRAR
jgi:hypothetical protein